MILYSTQREVMGRYAFGLSEGLFSFRRAMILARHHTFEGLKQVETDYRKIEAIRSLAALVLYEFQVDVVDPRSLVCLQMLDSR